MSIASLGPRRDEGKVEPNLLACPTQLLKRLHPALHLPRDVGMQASCTKLDLLERNSGERTGRGRKGPGSKQAYFLQTGSVPTTSGNQDCSGTAWCTLTSVRGPSCHSFKSSSFPGAQLVQVDLGTVWDSQATCPTI